MITDVRSVIYPFMPTNAFYINGTFATKNSNLKVFIILHDCNDNLFQLQYWLEFLVYYVNQILVISSCEYHFSDAIVHIHLYNIIKVL